MHACDGDGIKFKSFILGAYIENSEKNILKKKKGRLTENPCGTRDS